MDLPKVTTPEWLSQFKALSDKSISHNVFETYIEYLKSIIKIELLYLRKYKIMLSHWNGII